MLDATINIIRKSVKKGDEVKLVGFGTFERRKRKGTLAPFFFFSSHLFLDPVRNCTPGRRLKSLAEEKEKERRRRST